MARTNATLIKAAMESGLVSDDSELDTAILMAAELSDEVCVPVGYAESRLTLIETQLAAHFFRTLQSQFVSSNSAGKVSESFQYKIGLNLAGTTHGQTAMMLDTAGGLAELSKKSEEGVGQIQVGMSHLGCPAPYPTKRYGR